ncbi:hypothetical protein NMG60_11031814 [Bertholletia excelsa]
MGRWGCDLHQAPRRGGRLGGERLWTHLYEDVKDWNGEECYGSHIRQSEKDGLGYKRAHFRSQLVHLWRKWCKMCIGLAAFSYEGKHPCFSWDESPVSFLTLWSVRVQFGSSDGLFINSKEIAFCFFICGNSSFLKYKLTNEVCSIFHLSSLLAQRNLLAAVLVRYSECLIDSYFQICVQSICQCRICCA